MFKYAFNIQSQNELSRLPKNQRETIEAVQRFLEKQFKKLCISAIPTSGFRNKLANTQAGGVANSKHIFGMARDFCVYGIFDRFGMHEDLNIKVIDSGISKDGSRICHVEMI